MCAERNAIGTMINNGESQITKLVCVDSKGNLCFPCGACREFLMQLDKDSKNIEKIYGGFIDNACNNELEIVNSTVDSVTASTGYNDVNDNTVTVYLKRIRKKLDSDIIKTIKGIGYRVDTE